jgi:4-diphosphocytidyl-2-C-methyl-D-erythritol kinase
MEFIKVKARAKINIALDVTGKRTDGYHELKSVMQTLSLHDTLFIKKVRKENYLKLVCSKEWLPADERNLVYRAAAYMINEYKTDTGLYIELDKKIPVSAGLAGGSSDCAATLIGIRNLFRLPLSNGDLAVIGARFGADVPFCVLRGTMLAEGVGERLTRLPPFPPVFVLLVKPPFSVSTSEVFSEYRANENERTDFDLLVKHISNQDITGICSQMKNALESVTAGKIRMVADLREAMDGNGAAGSLMSGSGPTVYGLFERKEDMEKAESVIRERFPEINEIIATRIFNV